MKDETDGFETRENTDTQARETGASEMMTTETRTPLYSIESYNVNLQDAANSFADSHFAEPRKASKVKGNTFKLKGGNATYEIEHVAGQRNLSVDRYEIYRLSSGA